MAFKMKGSSYKMGGHKTKATMAYMKNMKSPLEQAKPDYPDIDGDGNTTESMKKAAADKKSPLEQVVTQADPELDDHDGGVGSWHEEKKNLGNMSARDRRRAVKELKNELKVGNQPRQKTYWDKTTKTTRKIPGLFSSKKAKEDFILKQTMKKRFKDIPGEAMSYTTMQKYRDAGIDPTTLKPFAEGFGER